jgi:decaprenylphospho-beta-D-ribofuranose 2-oxidase
MLTAKKLKLTGWGGGPVADCYVVRPEREAELKLALEVAAKGGVIMRGNGRSYGDQATNDGGQVILSERLRRITAFDASSGIVTVEAGITISTLLSFMIKHSLMLPAVPGTSFVTIGGAIANDVHGKGHHKQGSFGNHRYHAANR